VYVGSRQAVEGITKSAAIELADTGVRVNIVGLGPVDWSRVSLCRFYGSARNSAPP
jgi:NAD(P)-dependent dehydrogenase (short-subunit alcohol dehydrogenase family)